MGAGAADVDVAAEAATEAATAGALEAEIGAWGAETVLQAGTAATAIIASPARSQRRA